MPFPHPQPNQHNFYPALFSTVCHHLTCYVLYLFSVSSLLDCELHRAFYSVLSFLSVEMFLALVRPSPDISRMKVSKRGPPKSQGAEVVWLVALSQVSGPLGGTGCFWNFWLHLIIPPMILATAMVTQLLCTLSVPHFKYPLWVSLLFCFRAFSYASGALSTHRHSLGVRES